MSNGDNPDRADISAIVQLKGEGYRIVDLRSELVSRVCLECLQIDERAKRTAIQLLARNNHLDLKSLTLIKLCFSRVLGTLGAYSGEPLDLTRRFAQFVSVLLCYSEA